MKIVFLFITKFSYRDYHRFGFEILKKRGHDLEIWEISSLFSKEYSDSYTIQDENENVNLKKIQNENELKIKFENLSGEIVIDAFNIFPKYNSGNKKKFYLGGTILGLLPSQKRNYYKIIKKIILNPNKLINYLNTYLRLKYKKKINYYDFVLLGGNKARYTNRYPTNEFTDYIDAHAFDYDRYLEQEQKKNVSFKKSNEYAVFLDEDVCFHPDYTLLNVEPYCSPDKYYNEINDFFKKFEKNTGYEIVIAKHPRNNSNENKFNGRKIISGKTIELVKYSEMVLLHSSTSINYAILYKKPALLLDSKNYDQNLRNSIKAFSVELALPMINISSEYYITLKYEICENKYDEYRHKYIKQNGTIKKNTWEIFSDYLELIN